MFYEQFKRCLSFLMVLVMVLSLMPFSAFAAEDEDATGLDAGSEVSDTTPAETEAPAPTETEAVTTESSEPAAEPEATVTVEEIQTRIDAIVDQYGITADLTDGDIANAIAKADGDTIKATMDEMDALEADAAGLTEEELLSVDSNLYSRFCDVLEQLYAPMLIGTASVLDGKITVSDDQNSISDSSGVVTITAKGSLFSKKINTITITNETDSKANITFDYSASTYNSFTIAGVSVSASGTYNATLDGGATITVVLTSNSGLSNTTATLTLSGFAYTAVSDNAAATVTYDSAKGSVSLGGSAVASGGSATATGGQLAAAATPSSGCSFLGWINDKNEILSTAATATLNVPQNMNVQAVFVNSTSDTAWFNVDNKYLTTDLTTAGSMGTKIVLANNGTLPAGNYTIPVGVTLLIPYNDANTLCTTKPTNAETYATPTVYRTLTMANGANLTVNGVLSLSGQQSSKYAYNGMPYGPLPFIKMNSGSTITVENGGALYAWGYITGSGSVAVKSGGTVYECFQIPDYRGGDATSNIVGKDDEYGVFPFNQYYIQNVEVPMTLYAGAVEKGFLAVSVTLAGIQTSEVPIFGSSNSMFTINSGYVVKDYMEGTGRTSYLINGGIVISSITVSLKVSTLGSLTIDSSKYAFPIPQHMTVTVAGGNLDIKQDIALLPGSEIYVNQGASCTLASGNNIYVYDLDQWLYNDGANGYSGTANLPYMNIPYVPGGNGTTGRLKDALVQINGEIDATASGVYVTTGGANICSTGNGVLKQANITDSIIYQVITNDTAIGSWPEICITPAKLKNADGTYLQSSTNTYTYTDGFWRCETHTMVDGTCSVCGYVDAHTHSYTENITAPTCTADGVKTFTCSGCGDSYTEGISATGHQNTTVINQVDATCGEAGYSGDTYCNDCKTTIATGYETSASGNHSYESTTVDATCTADGSTTYTCTACGDTYTEAVAALGHTEGTPGVENNVDATCTADGSYERVVYCTVCGNEISRETVTTDALGHIDGEAVTENEVEATCTESGSYDTVIYCSVCGEEVSREVATVDALGHTEIVDEAVAATCTASGLTEGKHCSVCTEVLVAQEKVPALGHKDAGNDGNHTCDNFGCSEIVTECSDSYDKKGFCGDCGAYEPCGGSGTVEDPYTIGNAGQLYWFAAVVNGGYGDVSQNLTAKGKLVDNIVVNQNVLAADGTLNLGEYRVWTPIGSENDPYTGTFDGDNHTISGLYFNNSEAKYVGLFGNMSGGSMISNLGIVDSYFCGNQYVGAVAGCGIDARNCHNSGTVIGTKNVGGIVGGTPTQKGTFDLCYNTGNITATDCNLGGIIGYAYLSTVTPNCYNTGNITGGYNVGGIVGYGSSMISENCWNSGAVSGTSTIGGIMGYMYNGGAQKCYNLGPVSGSNSAVGGIIGYVTYNGGATRCYNAGQVHGASLVGGITGYSDGAVSATRSCYNIGAVTANEGATAVGSILGYTYENLIKNHKDCYYLEGTTAVGVGVSTEEYPDLTTAMTAEQFASGEVAYLLNGGATENQTWFQDIGTDKSPLFEGSTVYRNQTGGCTDETYTYSYSNAQVEAVTTHTEVVDAAEEADCTNTGLTEGKHCNRCGEVLVAQTEAPALGHNEVTDAAVAPTCTETGLTECKHCDRCGEVLTAPEVVPATGKHVWDNGVETNAPTATEDGEITYTCGTCGETKNETIPATGEHVHTPGEDDGDCTTAVTCSVCGAVTTPANVEHNYVDGVCSICNKAEPDEEKYVAQIDSEMYLTLTDAINAAEFSDTITLLADVTEKPDAVLAEGVTINTNGKTLWNVNTATALNSIIDNGPVLTRVNGGCEAVQLDENTWTVKAVFSYSMQAGLLLEEEVKMQISFKPIDGNAVAADRVGVLIWPAASYPEDDNVNIENCDESNILMGAVWNSSLSRYEVVTDGIPAKEMGDLVTFVPFYIREDGGYVYGRVIKDYSPRTYCYNMLKDDETRNDALMIAILNYGAAAQVKFNYRTDDLMNSELTAEQQTISWDGSLARTDWSVSTDKAGELQRNTAVVTGRGGGLELLGAIDTRFYVVIDPSVEVKNVEILCWTESDYNNLDVLTIDNASFTETMEFASVAANGNRYEYSYTGLAAKEIFTAIYTCAVITDVEGNVYYGGVLAYSPERYISINASKTDADGELAKRLAIYCDAARTYFG